MNQQFQMQPSSSEYPPCQGQNQISLQQLKESIIEEVRKNQGELMMNMQANNGPFFNMNQQNMQQFPSQPAKKNNHLNKQMQMLSLDENESDLGSWRI